MKFAAEILLIQGGAFVRTITAVEAEVLLSANPTVMAKGSRSTIKAIIVPAGCASAEKLIGGKLPKEKPYSHCYETPTNPRGCWELRRIAA